MRVFSAAYRLAPEYPFPAAVDDALSAYQWLVTSRESWGPLVVAGFSAGGGLALAMLLRAREKGLQPPATCICLAPWADLRDRGEDDTASSGRPSPHELAWWAESYLGVRSALEPETSPVLADLRGLPPLLIQLGDADPLLPDSLLLEKRAKASGVRVTLDVRQGLHHGFHGWWPLVPEAVSAFRSIGSFVQSV
jgi:epsilon-lactone hydrolase